MIKTITNIDYLEDVALVTVNNIPNNSKNVSFILNEIAARDVTVDMICQTAPYKDKISLSFTVPQDSLAEVIAATTAFRKVSKEISTDVNGNNTKIILFGEGMRNTSGVAAELFDILAEADIPVKLITTGETEISCLLDIKDIDKAKNLINK